MSINLSELLEEVTKTLNGIVHNDTKGNEKTTYEKYKTAFKQLNNFTTEFVKMYDRHYERAEDLTKTQPPGSSMTDRTQLLSSPTNSSPKLSHFVKLSNVELDNVGGLEGCKRVLIEAALWPIKYPKFFTGKFLFHHCILTSRFSNLCF